MRYGYARVSTADQSLDVQQAALRAAGCDFIRGEKRSGTKLTGRDELADLLQFIREGDVLVVTRLDRLARSVPDLFQILKTLDERGASLECVEQPFETHSATGRLMLGVVGVFAEFETALRKERQMEGIRAAKARGAFSKGRVRTIDRDRVRKVFAETGRNKCATAKALRISTRQVGRIIAEFEGTA